MKNRNRVFIFLIGLIFLLGMSINVSAYTESPMLSELVEKGELPPVEERLPEKPLEIGSGVLIPEDNLDWEVGKYGGTLRAAHETPGWHPSLFIMMNERLLGAPGISTQNIYGDVVEDFEVNEDNTVFTFYMREGLKWSDGYPVTTEDVRFAYEDVLLNEKLTPVISQKYRDPEGENMEISIIDDYTFQIKFNNPYGGFLSEITYIGWAGYTDIIKPRHFLKDYHIDYTPLADMKEAMEEEQLEEEWWRLFELKDVVNNELTNEQAIGFPVLYPWMRVEGPAGKMVFERNPYYFAVDTEGKQLPYIDTITSMEVSDLEMLQMKAITGEVDFMARGLASIDKLPLYKENEDRGNYEVQLLDKHYNPVVFFLNYTFKDPVWREVTSDINFRKALSLAIDREEIIEAIYRGLASLPAEIPMPSAYNPTKAEELLDEMGMNGRDNEGYRLAPNGEEFEIFIEVAPQNPDFIPICELLVEYFNEVGIKTSMKQISPSLKSQKAPANELMATIDWAPEPQWKEGTKIDYLPGIRNRCAPLWALWHNTDGKEGEEPPADVKEIYRLHGERQKYLPHSPEDKEAIGEIYSLHYDNLYYFFLVHEVKELLITSKDLRNVPHGGWTLEASDSGEQFFFAE